MKKDLTLIVSIIDKSGSMESIRNDAIGGFNTFLEAQQKEPGEARMDLVLFSFDGDLKIVCENALVGEVKRLDTETYVPNGGTALYDAIGETVTRIGARIAAMKEDERPEKVIVTILTDGEENASRKFTREQVFEMISHQTDVYKWQFVFLAANQDAMIAGSSIGISKSACMSFSGDSKGMGDAFSGYCCAVSSYRSTGAIAADWKTVV